MFLVLTAFNNLALLAFRLAFAAIFLAHGWPKIKNLQKTAEGFSAMGFRPGKFWGTYAAFLEVFGGVAVLLGIQTQLFGLLFAGEMAVIIIWRMKNGQKLVGGYELDLMLLVAGLILATMGSGSLALMF